MNWLYYIAEANLYLGVFYLAYCVLLSTETHYQLNRGFLLASCVVALVIPVITLGFLKPVEYLVLSNTPVAVELAPAPAFTWVNAVLYLYIIGVVFFAARFMLKLYQLKKLIENNSLIPANGYQIVTLEGADTAFSFFNYLFVGTRTNEAALITRHELVHISQKHSADIVFVELLQIVSWFNPAVYLLQNSLKTVHEYVADEQTAASETDTIAYATYLLNNAYGISGPAMTHSFFNYNLLKKRITMLHQKRSGSLARLKYLIAVPLCAGLLCQSTFGFDKDYGLINIAPKPAVIVQGGTDTIPAKPAQVSVKPQAVVEQVLVKDKNGKLVDINSKKGKAIHVENLAKEKAKGYVIREKDPQSEENTSTPNIPAANVEQVVDGKVKGYVIRTKAPTVGSSYIIDKNDRPINDALNREGDGKVKGINIQNNASPAMVEKLLQQEKAKSDKPTGGAEIRIEEPQTEMRIQEQQSEIRIEEPAQKPTKKAPTPRPARSAAVKKEVVDVPKLGLPKQPAPPKPEVSKVKFPKPVLKPGVTEVKLTPPKPDVSKVKFPPSKRPVKKKKVVDVVLIPPPPAKPDNK